MNKIFVVLFFVALVTAQTLNPSRATLNANDANAMRYAVTLENLEANFYNTMQVRFPATAFASANLPGINAGTWSIFEQIRGHENAHVTFLNSAIAALGLAAVPNCTYNFASVTTVQLYIQTAALLETTGVSAYDGAINTVFNSSVVQALATIATIEARHASYLAGLNNSMPISSSSFDTALSPATIGGAITSFLTCPYTVSNFFPEVLKVVPVAGPIPADPTAATLSANDNNLLNYALYLEYLEEAFYIAGQTKFSTTGQFTNEGFNASVYLNLNLIRQHESAHVSALVSTIQARGGTPIAKCTTYDFSKFLNNVTQYLSTAALLEGTGVSAYDGAVNTIYDSTLKQVAATIATIEARHASYLNNVTNANGGPILPAAYDTAVAPATIAAAVAGLGVASGCPSLTLPTVITLNAYQQNTTNGLTSTTGGSTTSRTTGVVTGTSTTSSSSSLSVLFSFTIVAAFVALF